MSVNFDNLHALLRGVYEDMMPQCSNMLGLAKGIAGLGALFYIAYRIWKSLANAEPIDVFPLLRPFVLGLCIMFFPSLVIGTINTVLSPVTRACSGIVDSRIAEAKGLQIERDQLEKEAISRNPVFSFVVDDEEFDRQLEELGIMDTPKIVGMYFVRFSYKVRLMVFDAFRWLMELLFQASSLVIDTIRTFFLVVLTILGPIVFAFSVYDGFHNTLSSWLARYINIYMWLPVSDILSGILTHIRILLLKGDIAQFKDPSYVADGSSAVYIIFMIIGIIGYLCVPTISSWIVQAGGTGAYGKAVNKGAAVVGGMSGATSGHISGKLKGR
jgi:conjugative transposon TraJ protein